jgi:hypothetical protein
MEIDRFDPFGTASQQSLKMNKEITELWASLF